MGHKLWINGGQRAGFPQAFETCTSGRKIVYRWALNTQGYPPKIATFPLKSAEAVDNFGGQVQKYAVPILDNPPRKNAFVDKFAIYPQYYPQPFRGLLSQEIASQIVRPKR